jgi:uncharacterized protein (DUF2147 family)
MGGTVRTFILRLATLLFAALSATVANGQAPIEGVWLTPDDAEVTVVECGEQYCGSLSRLSVSPELLAQHGGDALAAMQSFVDDQNKDAALRTRPRLGLQIVTVRPTNDPGYFEGEVYNPTDGNTYSGSLQVVGPLQITLKGCALIILCREQIWSRVE